MAPPSLDPTPDAAREWDLQNGDPTWQTWSVEHPWDESFGRNL
jgi:hypothetical protein